MDISKLKSGQIVNLTCYDCRYRVTVKSVERKDIWATNFREYSIETGKLREVDESGLFENPTNVRLSKVKVN